MADDLRIIFATNLRRHMNAQNKTQADMARHFGISTATASDWYNGNKIPRADKLQSIANWLHIDLADLLSDPEQIPSKTYYLDPETAQIAQKIFTDDKILFDVYQSSKRDQLMDYARKLAELEALEEGL